MKTQEIASEQWSEFLDQFSRLHHGKPVTVQTVNRQIGAETNTKNLPLLGIVDQKTSNTPGMQGRQSIQIMAGAPGAQVGHTVDQPSRIRYAEWNDGGSAALDIECSNGAATIVQVGPQEQLLPPEFAMDGTVMGQPAHH